MFVTSLLLTAAVVAAQSATRTSTPSATGEPCGLISDLVFDSSYIPAASAAACLESVPVDVTGDEKLIDEIKLTWEFQSEIGWLKNTPPEWELGKIDIMAKLDEIKANLSSFSSEYAVQNAIQDLAIKTGNYHWNYRPDILQVFQFIRSIDLVSLSSDGNSLPKLYESFDAITLAEGGSGVSEITQINGEDAYDYLQKVAALEQYIDGDGQLNSMLYKGDTQSPGSFQFSARYDGATTRLTFANGSDAEFDNYAVTDESFSSVTDGESFFQEFCTGAISGSTRGKEEREDGRFDYTFDVKPHIPGFAKPTRYVPGLDKRQSIPSSYPDAVAVASDGSVGGYFLTGDGYEDVAVLKVMTFAPDEDPVGNEFQAVIKDFLEQCVSENKQKLIVDLRENGGGSPHLVLDMFMQLFPEEEPFCAQRYRAQEQFMKIGEVVNNIHESGELSSFEEEDFDSSFRYWAWWRFITAQGENFESWADFSGPHQFNGDSFTTLMRYNISDPISVGDVGFRFVNGTRPTAFNASNVVMFTDGMCGSACATIHEELKNVAGVKAVVVGGRPRNEPMQTLSGTKGGEVLPLWIFPEYAGQLMNYTEAQNDNNFGILENSKVNDLAAVSQALIRTGDRRTRIQTQDALRKGDTTGTPLQYIYEAADCKIFYTASTFADPEAAWKAAWDAFQDDSNCVQGSTGHNSSISGGYKIFGAGDVSEQQEPSPTETPPSGASPTGSATGTARPGNSAGKLGGSAFLTLAVAIVASLML